ncbi:MAG TPA: Clp protease ClpP [Bacteroidales bacterium]|nr:Clp protease ClpP [Bacteroidales bacterium]
MAKKELYINYDIEGTFWGELGTLSKIKNELSKESLTAEDELHVIINTYGGEIFEAISIRDYFNSLPCKKSITVSGICASAGTEILLAFENRNITKGSFVMFHPAMGGVYGNRHDMQKVVSLLEKLDNEFLVNYKKNLIVDVDNLEELIKNEWWLNADDFVKHFGGNLIENKKEIANKIKINNTVFRETMAKFEKLKNGGSTKRPFNLEKFKNYYESK